ncbi:MAG TPA: nucleoside/nucleotide kinase family protein [Paracoccaceae bacterium]|nr:nucleoside/nucleotide kinase family protein [Paracoccaceae bacterium]
MCPSAPPRPLPAPGQPIAPQALLDRLLALPRGPRALIALAGPPGSGKSTLAAALVERIDAAHPGLAALLPMDGYHFDDRVLMARGWRPRKGAPHTFDVGGLRAMLRRLRADDEDEIAVPLFDRDLEIARAGAGIIPRAARLVLVEGNYLLLDDPPWADLRPLFDLRALVMVPEPVLRARLRARWEGYGLDESQIGVKLEENDLPNGALVMARSGGAGLLVDGTQPLP